MECAKKKSDEIMGKPVGGSSVSTHLLDLPLTRQIDVEKSWSGGEGEKGKEVWLTAQQQQQAAAGATKPATVSEKDAIYSNTWRYPHDSRPTPDAN